MKAADLKNLRLGDVLWNPDDHEDYVVIAHTSDDVVICANVVNVGPENCVGWKKIKQKK
jgi:hypothetical protein